MTPSEQSDSGLTGLKRGEGWTFSCYPVPGGWQWSAWVAGVGGNHGFAYQQADAELAANRALAHLRGSRS